MITFEITYRRNRCTEALSIVVPYCKLAVLSQRTVRTTTPLTSRDSRRTSSLSRIVTCHSPRLNRTRRVKGSGTRTR